MIGPPELLFRVTEAELFNAIGRSEFPMLNLKTVQLTPFNEPTSDMDGVVHRMWIENGWMMAEFEFLVSPNPIELAPDQWSWFPKFAGILDPGAIHLNQQKELVEFKIIGLGYKEQ